MADTSKIEWTDATWNPVTGCTIVSEGCRNCYAMGLAATRLKDHPSRAGLTRRTADGRAVWTGEVRLNEQWLDQPLRWRRPRMIFVCAHGDLFHEMVPDTWIDRVFAVMALAPQHTFQVLTKRPERMRTYFSTHPDVLRDRWYRAVPAGKWAVSVAEAYAGIHPHCSDETRTTYHRPVPRWPLPNVWLGTSVEDQKAADERIPHLLATPAAVRFVSAEPLLGPVDFQRFIERCHADRDGDCRYSACPQLRDGEPEKTGRHCPIDTWPDREEELQPLINWIIVGGESGEGARAMHPDWARAIRDQCKAAGTAFFMKQMSGVRKPLPPIPDDLMVRQMPEVRR